jgi:hypothetical protein
MAVSSIRETEKVARGQVMLVGWVEDTSHIAFGKKNSAVKNIVLS